MTTRQSGSWHGLAAIAAIGGALGYASDLAFNHGEPWFLFRMALVALVVGLTFRALSVRPKAVPWHLPRWALQVAGVAAAVPATTLVIWSVTTPTGFWPFWQDKDRLMEFALVTVAGLLVSPWVALAVLVRQREAFAREQEMAFRLARSELERREQQARLHLIQAQVAPHFLFNTLANVQALVECGSPKAAELLRALTIYLRSAVQRVEGDGHSLGQEMASVQAYLELMHMRMPDRLQFTIAAATGTEDLRCPPLAVLTLVENAVRHGIDPCETGGRIDVTADIQQDLCRVRVTDTGVGVAAGASGCGTGLATLRQRLHLAFGASASLRLENADPKGCCATIEFAAVRIGS